MQIDDVSFAGNHMINLSGFNERGSTDICRATKQLFLHTKEADDPVKGPTANEAESMASLSA